jgi:hypothetical protein
MSNTDRTVIEEIYKKLKHSDLELTNVGFANTTNNGTFVIHANDRYWFESQKFWEDTLKKIDDRLIYVSHTCFHAPTTKEVIDRVRMTRERQVWVFVGVHEKSNG